MLDPIAEPRLAQRDDRWVFLVMEYCGGGDMDRYLREEVLEAEEREWWGRHEI